MNRIFFKVVKFLAFASLFVGFSAGSFAAEFSFIDAKGIGPLVAEDGLMVDLILDTQGENINALEGTIIFPTDLLELKRVDDGGSIVNYWINRPDFKDDNFAGIIPAGFNGRAKVLSLIFEVKAGGNDIIDLTDARVLLNDGKASDAVLGIKDFPFQFPNGASIADDTLVKDELDTDPPEEFNILFTKDENLFDGQYVLIFATQDKGSGVAYYAVNEGEGFYEAQSPYVLSEQGLSQGVIVRAFDKAGNFREETFDPKQFDSGFARLFSSRLMFGISLAVIGILVLLLLRSIIFGGRKRPARRR